MTIPLYTEADTVLTDEELLLINEVCWHQGLVLPLPLTPDADQLQALGLITISDNGRAYTERRGIAYLETYLVLLSKRLKVIEAKMRLKEALDELEGYTR